MSSTSMAASILADPSSSLAHADGHAADTRTEAQRLALLQLVKDLKEEHPITSIHGHNEFANRACPCFDVQQWRRENKL